MVRGVRRHLERGIHGHIEGELVGYGSVHVAVIPAPLLEVLLEYARSEVHRASVETGELENGGVARLCAAEGLVFGAAGGLIAYEVRIGPAETGRAYRLVGIDHNVMFGCLGHGIEIVVHEPLAVMVLAVRQYVADIAALDGIVAVLIHKVVGGLHVTLVVSHRRGAFVVHHQPDALGMGIFIEGSDVEVRIRGHEVEDIVLVAVCPVLPAYVPALDKQGVETVLGSEVYIGAHLFIVGAVTAVRLCGGIVGYTEAH